MEIKRQEVYTEQKILNSHKKSLKTDHIYLISMKT